MKKVTMSFGASLEYKPANPERTAKCDAYSSDPMSCDVTFQEWPNRASMARTIRMQERRERKRGDWKACVALSETEGF